MNINEFNVKILMADRCNKAEAIKFLKTGTTIYDDIEDYVTERNSIVADEDKKITCDQIRAGEVADIGYVELDGIGYVIEYVNWYEEIDKKEGNYEDNFYAIVNENHEEVEE